MRKLLYGISIVFLLSLAAPFSVFAQAAPSLPVSFYGTATVNGITALPAGTTIKAYYGSSSASSGEITTIASGKYGAADPANYNGWTDSPLVVSQGDGTIYFKAIISGYNSGVEITANTTSSYDVITRRLDLAFTATANGNGGTVTTVTGGGGGGGGGTYYSPYTITINGGATSTTSLNVTLALTAQAGMNQMWISNDSSFATSTGTGWIPFQTAYPWILTSGSGNKTVYVSFGNTSTATPTTNAQASIAVIGGGTSGTSGGTSGALYTAQLQLLNALIAQLQLLLQQAQAQGITLPSGASQFLAGASSTPSTFGKLSFSFHFANNMGIGTVSSDVSVLQRVLNALGFTVAASGAGSPGNETTYFGVATKNALKRYQQAVTISATGYLGPLTRASLNALSQ